MEKVDGEGWVTVDLNAANDLPVRYTLNDNNRVP